MKRLFFLGCTIAILLSVSCKKDSADRVKNVCAQCITDTSSGLHLETIHIIDSSWAAQGSYIFKSDLTQLIKQAGAAVSEVYALQLDNQGMESQFFPCCPVSFDGGELSGSIYSTGTDKTCTLTFTFPDHEAHNGERFNSTIVPFESVRIKVWLWK
jgi:hypothetical protein